MRNRQNINPFKIIELLTGSSGFRTPIICCLRLRYSERPHTTFELPVESKTRTCHGRVTSRRTASKRGRVEQYCLPKTLFVLRTILTHALQSIEETSPKHLPRRTNKRNRTCRIPNPVILRARRFGAPGGAAGRSLARLGANRTIRSCKKVHHSLQAIEEMFSDIPCMERIYRDKKKRRSTVRQPGTKRPFRLGDKPLMHR